MVYNTDGIVIHKPSLISDDAVLNDLNNRAMLMYSSYYDFDVDNQACVFDYEQEKKDAPIMLDIIEKIHKRLDEINDGSFKIEDYETERLIDLL